VNETGRKFDLISGQRRLARDWLDIFDVVVDDRSPSPNPLGKHLNARWHDAPITRSLQPPAYPRLLPQTQHPPALFRIGGMADCAVLPTRGFPGPFKSRYATR